MSRIPSVRRLSVLTGLAEQCWQHQPSAPPDTRAATSMGAGMRPVAGTLSFWRIVHVPFAAFVAGLESWQLTRHDGELRVGRSSAGRYLAGRDPPSPGAAAPAGTNATGHRSVVRHLHRT
jgi:hypothetical protein